jgi:hypothetical protein
LIEATKLQVGTIFDESYLSQVTLPDMEPANLPLPEILREYLEDEIGNWITVRFNAMQENGQMELAVRPFLRWLDRNLETLFTEGKTQFPLSLSIFDTA